jgi:uncharacterized protein (DUF488 family)
MKDISNVVDLFTIGYEGTDIERFLDQLVAEKIETLVDVRQLPLSRKKGFSKNKLKEAAALRKIDYVHIRSLGDPKEGRLAARSGNHKLFVDIFSAHMQTPEAKAGLVELSNIAQLKRSCLLCFEKHHEGCHRSIVVDKLSKHLEIEVRHLVVE